MLLTGSMMAGVATVNNFEYVPTAEISAGDSGYVYFQLKDASVFKSNIRYYPSGRRYVPAVGATLLVEINNLNDARKIVRFASAPFPEDRSIWRLQILPTDNISAGTYTFILVLNEGGVFTRGSIQTALNVNGGFAYC